MKPAPLLRLIRLPNLFTAPVDSMAGWYLAGAAAHAFNDSPLQAIATAFAVAATSILCYLGGIILNDLVDLEVDRIERPGRPLPSNAVSPRFALILSIVSFLAALALSPRIGGQTSLVLAALLILAVVLYNTVLKGTLAGLFAMGLCRGLNVLLGASAGILLGGPPIWVLAVAITVYVAGITAVSRGEARPGDRSDVWFGLFLFVAAFGLLAFVPTWHALWWGGPDPRYDAWDYVSFLGLTVVAVVLVRAVTRALRSGTPGDKQLAVKAGVLSLPFLHAAVVLCAGGWPMAIALITLGLTARLIARRLYVT